MNGKGVSGVSTNNVGVEGFSSNWRGVSGVSTNNDGVWGETSLTNQSGVVGYTQNGTAVGVTGIMDHRGSPGRNLAGQFFGNVDITGTTTFSALSLRIDHPLDPANKYLYHSSVESPDMKNMYDGVIALNEKGEAEIELPDWFGGLNKDLRYQLTAIGTPGPNLYVAKEISEVNTKDSKSSRFKVAGGTSGMKVSWQVTGIRADPYSKTHPIKIEEDKPENERGYYLYPDLYGEPKEKMVNYSIISRDVSSPKEQPKNGSRVT